MSLNPSHINRYYDSNTGNTGSDVVVTLSKFTDGNRTVRRVWVSAPSASADATLVVYKDSSAGTALTGTLYLAAIPSDRGIELFKPEITDIAVKVTSSASSSVYVNVEYERGEA